MIKILMTMEHPKTKQKFIVEYDETSYDHSAFEIDEFLGRVRLRELFFAGFKCVDRDITIDY